MDITNVIFQLSKADIRDAESQLMRRSRSYHSDPVGDAVINRLAKEEARAKMIKDKGGGEFERD